MLSKSHLIDLLKKTKHKLEYVRGVTIEDLPESILLRPVKVIISYVLLQLEKLQTEAPDSQAIGIVQSFVVSLMQAGSTAAGEWLLQHRNRLSANTLYPLAAQGNRTAVRLLGLLAEDELAASTIIEQTTDAANNILLPNVLLYLYMDEALYAKRRVWHLVPRRFYRALDIYRESHERFLSAAQLDELRQIDWHNNTHRRKATEFDSLSHRVHQLLSEDNRDNRYTLYELSRLHTSSSKHIEFHYNAIIVNLSKTAQAIDLMITAGKRKHYKIVHDLAIHIKANDKALRASRILYYQNPTNPYCIYAYYKCLSDCGSNTEAIIAAGIEQKVDEITYQQLFVNRYQTEGALAVVTQKETLEILRDLDQSTALKQRIFNFLFTKEQEPLTAIHINILKAICYEEGLGVSPDPAKARENRMLAARLGDITSYDIAYPTQQHPVSLLRAVRDGSLAALKKLQRHVANPSYKYAAAAQQCLIDCYEPGFGCPSDLEETEFKLTDSPHIKFCLMAIGASDKTYHNSGMEMISKGYNSKNAQLHYADLTRSYIDACTDGHQARLWRHLAATNSWCVSYFDEREDIPATDIAAWLRLKQGRPISINIKWRDDGTHSIQLVFFKFQDQYYLTKSNRGANGQQEQIGTTPYHIGNIEYLKNRGATKQLINNCLKRQYSEGMDSTTANTFGYDLQLTLIQGGHFNQTSHKGGTCALAATQNAYRTLLAISYLHQQTDYAESKASDERQAISLTADKFIRAFEASAETYKAWRAAMRIALTKHLAAAGTHDGPAYIRSEEHLPIMTLVLQYLLAKCKRDNERPEVTYQMCEDSICAIRTRLFSDGSRYSEEQKEALQREMDTVTLSLPARGPG
ncbi:MAG: hypothetical protein P1U34_08285 [Coxiellaceae bacterium]|nr:hypothetical protein [Coxiellaceae bacterium]